MAENKTISFKIDEHLSERTKQLIDASGLTAKDWFEKAVALAEMQSLKDAAPDYAGDLSELEGLTTRIIKLVSNMAERSINLKENAVNDLEVQLEQQRQITTEFQLKVSVIEEEKELAIQNLKQIQLVQSDLSKQLEELRATLDTNKLLVAEYKEKNDTLSGLVTKYQRYADENEELKTILENERTSTKAKIDELTHLHQQSQSSIAILEGQLDVLTESHKHDLERLSERKDVELQKTLLQAEREHQKALNIANNQANEKIQSLYETIEKQRQTFEQKNEELQHQLSVERANYNESIEKQRQTYEEKIEELQQLLMTERAKNNKSE